MPAASATHVDSACNERSDTAHRRVEGFFDAARVVCINVDEQDALVHGQKSEDREHHIIDVRKAGRAVAPSVRLPPNPIDRDICLPFAKSVGRSDRASSVNL